MSSAAPDPNETTPAHVAHEARDELARLVRLLRRAERSCRRLRALPLPPVDEDDIDGPLVYIEPCIRFDVRCLQYNLQNSLSIIECVLPVHYWQD